MTAVAPDSQNHLTTSETEWSILSRVKKEENQKKIISITVNMYI